VVDAVERFLVGRAFVACRDRSGEAWDGVLVDLVTQTLRQPDVKSRDADATSSNVPPSASASAANSSVR
jgi:hypothetical protein